MKDHLIGLVRVAADGHTVLSPAAARRLVAASTDSQPAREHLKSIPYIALDPKESPTTRHAAVAFTVATYGINVPGTVYRMDDVPIPLRPAFDSPFPSDYEILTGIEKRVKQLRAGANGLPAGRTSLRPALV